MHQKFRVPKALTAFAFGLLFLGGIGGTGYAIYVLLEGQVTLLIEKGPEIAQTVRARIQSLFAAHPWIEQQLSAMEFGAYARTTAETLFSGVQNTIAVLAGTLLILALGLYVAIQQLEGDVTIPLVMKGRVKLPEAHLLAFVFVMGGLFGLLGVFVAPPLFATGRRILIETYVRKMDAKTRPARPAPVAVAEESA